jgi:hypothetical protein
MTLIVMAIPRRRRTYGGRSRALRLRPVGVPMAAAVPMAAYGRLWPPMAAAYGRRRLGAQKTNKTKNKKKITSPIRHGGTVGLLKLLYCSAGKPIPSCL